MGDWLGLGIIVLVLAGALCGMSRLGRAPEPLSAEEFERRVAESRGTMSAGVVGLMYALQKLMHPQAAEAIEVQKDLRAGFYDDCFGQCGGGGDEGMADEGDPDEPAVRKKDSELIVAEDDEGEDDA